MPKHSIYAEMGLRALRRAARKVAEDAIRNNYKLPIWQNGRVQYITPKLTDYQDEASDKNR